MNLNEVTYWVALALMPKMWTKRKNQLYVECFRHTPQYSLADLFERRDVRSELGVMPEEEPLFEASHDQLANIAFMVEDLISQGYEIIPLNSPDYPKTLKENLKQGAPCVLYTKGNKSLLNTMTTAIVGSRNADSTSLEFTVNIARRATSENKTVVSGFAKGVDRQALDAAIESHGKSIIVLPQGITTFASGFRQYYQQIYQGLVTVISIFHPKAAWSKELAMARNSIIYGLSNEIYAAQSDSNGGTWSGVIDGLRKGRKIYVRVPYSNEKNANLLLIQKGCIGVDIYGNVVEESLSGYKYKEISETHICSEPEGIYEKCVSEELFHDDFKNRILQLLTDKKMSKELLKTLNLDWSDSKMKKYLRSLPEVEEEKKSGKIFFFKKEYSDPTLF